MPPGQHFALSLVILGSLFENTYFTFFSDFKKATFNLFINSFDNVPLIEAY